MLPCRTAYYYVNKLYFISISFLTNLAHVFTVPSICLTLSLPSTKKLYAPFHRRITARQILPILLSTHLVFMYLCKFNYIMHLSNTILHAYQSYISLLYLIRFTITTSTELIFCDVKKRDLDKLKNLKLVIKQYFLAFS